MKSADIAALPPEIRRQMAVRERLRGLGEADVVKAWYASDEPFDLNDREDTIRRRWDWAKAQFLALASYGEVVQSLMREFGISIAQARIDVRNMRHAFGNLDEVPKAVHRERAIEMTLKAYKIAESKQDSDGMTRAAEAYARIVGLDKDDAERLDIEKLMKERTYVEVLDPTVRSLLLNFLQASGGVVDVSAFFERVHTVQESGDFVDYEEMPKESAAE